MEATFVHMYTVWGNSVVFNIKASGSYIKHCA